MLCMHSPSFSQELSFCVRKRIEKHCPLYFIGVIVNQLTHDRPHSFTTFEKLINYSLVHWYCTGTRRAPIVNKMGARHQGQDCWMTCHPSIENYASVTDISFVRNSLTQKSSSMYKCMKYNLISALDIALLDYGPRFASVSRFSVEHYLVLFGKSPGLSLYFSMCRMSIIVAKWTFLSFSCASFMTSSLESLRGPWIYLPKFLFL